MRANKHIKRCVALTEIIHHFINSCSSFSLDVYAAVLQRTHHVSELEKLIPFISGMNEYSTESYTAMAYALFALHKLNRANTIANQAMQIAPNNVEAIILRGNILIEQKKYQDALHHFRQALQLKPHRYEAHKGLVDCFVGMHRLREASNVASSAYKQLGSTPRVLTVTNKNTFFLQIVKIK